MVAAALSLVGCKPYKVVQREVIRDTVVVTRIERQTSVDTILFPLLRVDTVRDTILSVVHAGLATGIVAVEKGKVVHRVIQRDTVIMDTVRVASIEQIFQEKDDNRAQNWKLYVIFVAVLGLVIVLVRRTMR